jgi:hypothetical protein
MMTFGVEMRNKQHGLIAAGGAMVELRRVKT